MWVLSPMSERQIKVLDRFLDWFEDNLTSHKCAANAKCSADSALSDINDLIARDVICKCQPGGQSSSKCWLSWLCPHNCGLLTATAVVSGNTALTIDHGPGPVVLSVTNTLLVCRRYAGRPNHKSQGYSSGTWLNEWWQGSV